LVQQDVSPFSNFVSRFINIKDVNEEKIQEQILEIKSTRLLPVYEGNIKDSTFYIFPMHGKGLWGSIWGYVSLAGDFNTIHGAYFSHQSETPGLGAEIATYEFQDKFIGRKIYDDNEIFVSVKVIKGGAAVDELHGVDAISGGTITSNGVEKMLENFLSGYNDFIKKEKND